MNRKKFILPIIFAVIYGVYLTCLFLICNSYTESFWVSFAFITVAYLFVVFAFVFVSKNGREKQVVGLPLRSLCVLYCVAEFVLGTLFMFFSSSLTAVLVPQLIIFAMFFIVFIYSLLSPNNYKDNNNQ